MPEARVAKKVFAGHPEGKRPVGKPRSRWEDGVRRDAAELMA